VLLRGHAINYVTHGQDASGLSFGGRKQTNPPELGQDVVKLIDKGVAVSLVEEDAVERNVEPSALISRVRTIPRSKLPGLFAQFDQIWHW